MANNGRRALLAIFLALSLPQAAVQCQEIASHPTKSAIRAIAYLNPTKGNQANGWVRFKEVDGGVLITAEVDGLSPGKHGFHIHEHGDCSAPDASSAGGHFNPANEAHGGPDFVHRHAGDLGNIVANEKGHAFYQRLDKVISLSGPNSIIGRAIIVHAAADDYKTQPTGNAGGRLACGIIEER